MTEPVHYRVPRSRGRFEIVISKSRFIATADNVSGIAATKAFLAEVRAEMPGASHHVYAFRVGFGNTVQEGMSDDGEPSGTAGPPVLAIIRGSGIGDIMIVVTRYFGGTKLGTGGLVRAYSEAARGVLSELPTEEKIPRCVFGIEVPYSLFTQVKRVLVSYEATVLDEVFAADIAMIASIPRSSFGELAIQLADLSNGKVVPVIMEED